MKEIITETQIRERREKQQKEDRIKHTRTMEEERKGRKAKREKETLLVEVKTKEDEKGNVTCTDVICTREGCEGQSLVPFSSDGQYDSMMICPKCRTTMVDKGNLEEILERQ